MDREIVARFVERRDPDAFRRIVEEYQERVFRLVCSILGPWSDLDAEEVTQDVFLRVYRKAGQFRGESEFGSWLYRVAYSTALNHRQSSRIRLPHESDEGLAAEAVGPNPYEETLRATTKRRVAIALESLPDLYRTVLFLYYWQDFAVGEIAEAIGAPEGTVKSYLSRARERLRKSLIKKED